MSAAQASELTRRAEEDGRSRADQERLRSDDLLWREGEARRRTKAHGLAARLRSRPDDFLEEFDRHALRIGRACRRSPIPTPSERAISAGAGTLPLPATSAGGTATSLP
jgi:hypothetical protein